LCKGVKTDEVDVYGTITLYHLGPENIFGEAILSKNSNY